MLGDYWWRRSESLPSAALVALLAEFGVSDSAARAALSRLTRRKLLVTAKSGRRTVVRLSAPVRRGCWTTAVLRAGPRLASRPASQGRCRPQP